MDILKNLEDKLHYLYVIELKKIAEELVLSQEGKKAQLIRRIMTYISTGEKLLLDKYPKQSLGKKSELGAISADSLMLKGAYKNDRKTREFFKKMIGQHFHFTVFGLDWLEERWRNGNPPTYNQFIEMWREKYELHQKFPIPPKAEWKYIIFVQNYISMNKNFTKMEINDAWNSERNKALQETKEFLKKFKSDLSPIFS